MGIIIPKLRQSAGWRAQVILACSKCGETFDRGYRISRTRAAKPQFCSRECLASKPDKACETCGKFFRPRSSTKTRFCSMACNTVGIAFILSDEVREKRLAATRRAHEEGRIPHLKGAAKPNWKGGKSAFEERRKAIQQQRNASGEAAAALRAYRQANPDKVREFSQRRKGRKLDRLAYGTLPRIRLAQRNKCAICRTSLRDGDHVDHIVPLSKGGMHVAKNLQLLCPHCNVTKSGRDPIVHMQSLGRLL